MDNKSIFCISYGNAIIKPGMLAKCEVIEPSKWDVFKADCSEFFFWFKIMFLITLWFLAIMKVGSIL